MIGTSVAYHAAKRGLSVGLFKKGPLASGASGASLGLRSIWVWSHLLPLESGLKNDQRFIDFAQETGEDISSIPAGASSSPIRRTISAICTSSSSGLQKRGVEIRLLDQAEIREVEPNLSPRVIGAAWSPDRWQRHADQADLCAGALGQAARR